MQVRRKRRGGGGGGIDMYVSVTGQVKNHIGVIATFHTF